MSFVLDALKLSEERRSRFARPVYAHPPPVRRRLRRRCGIAVLAAAPILAGVFLTWRLIAPPIPAPHPEPAQVAEMSAAAETDAAATNAAPPAMDSLEETRGVEPANSGGATSASNGTEQTAAAAADAASVAEPAPAALPTYQGDSPPLDVAPPEWPPLTLQMLFYSPERDRSFVQINGSNYRAGERLDDGPRVLTIAPDGVILAHRGATVRLAMDR